VVNNRREIMANFKSTSNGLLDCLDAMKKALEDGKTGVQFAAELSDEERRGFEDLLDGCKAILDVAEELEEDPTQT
jgi:hypothetical protein